MGVIKRQGIKNSLVRYGGIVMGAINILFLYPLFLGEEKLGLINFIINTAVLFNTFVLLGANGVTVKFFPIFRENDNKHNGFLSFLLIWTFLGFILFLSTIYFLWPAITNYYGAGPSAYLIYVIPIVGMLAFGSIMQKYISNFNRIVVPTFLNQLYKVIVPILAALFFYQFMPFEWILRGIVIFYFIVLMVLILYTKHLGQWKLSMDFSRFQRPILKDIFTFAGFGLLGSIGSMMVVKIDIFMVGSLLDFSNTGIYSVALFIATVIRVPSEAIIAITAPILSDNFAKNNIKEIGNIYRKSSILLWTVGLLFLLGIWTNLDSLFRIMPDGATYAEGKKVVLILGIGILFDMLTSVNGEIIGYSRFFRFNFYILIFLALINIGANFFLIPQFKINGAAMATATSLILFNTIKLIFVYFKFGLLPFTHKTIYVLLITILTYLLVSFLPTLARPLLDIFFKSTTIVLLFVPTILYFEISEDINTLFWQLVDKIR